MSLTKTVDEPSVTIDNDEWWVTVSLDELSIVGYQLIRLLLLFTTNS